MRVFVRRGCFLENSVVIQWNSVVTEMIYKHKKNMAHLKMRCQFCLVQLKETASCSNVIYIYMCVCLCVCMYVCMYVYKTCVQILSGVSIKDNILLLNKYSYSNA